MTPFRRTAEFQRFQEHVAESGEVAFAKPADGTKIGRLLSGQPAKSDDIHAHPLQLPRRTPPTQ